MKFGHFTYRNPRARQHGYMLLIVMMFVFALALASLAVAPSIVQQSRRDKEEEMIHRGAQYARAIKKFVVKFHRYPTRIEELENVNNVRCLRQRYKDPMTPSGEWHLIHYGEVQLGPGGGLGAPTGPTGPGARTGGPGTPSPSAFSGPASTQRPSAFQGPATSGGTFGGGPIIGVSSTSERESLREFNSKNHYNQWQFIYDQTTDRGGLIKGPYQPLQQLMPGGQMPGMTPAGNQPKK